MPTKKTPKKKAAKKSAARKKAALRILDGEDPPIIVGGGSSEIIKIRGDLSVTPMPPAGGYTRFRVDGVTIKYVDVDGSSHPVDPATNSVRFLERAPMRRRR